MKIFSGCYTTGISDTLSLLHTAEMELQNAQEDINIVNKMSELSKLLKKPNIVCFV